MKKLFLALTMTAMGFSASAHSSRMMTYNTLIPMTKTELADQADNMCLNRGYRTSMNLSYDGCRPSILAGVVCHEVTFNCY